MKIAITGGTGFVGRHLARYLVSAGHEVVLIARGVDRRDPDILKLPHAILFASDLSDSADLVRAFAGCDGVAHCAGINREWEEQTY
jgi:nucleoside-diphosphate-sugar epimerase